jgi:hypothetical protein
LVRLLTAIAALVLLASCSVETPAEQQSPSAAASQYRSPRVGATPSSIPTTAIGFSQAWPNFKPRSVDSTTWVEVSIAPDGSVAFGEALAKAPPHAELGPAIMDRRTGNITVIRAFTNPNAQVVWIVGDATWVVWVEGSLQPTFADWVLYSFNRQNGQIRTLAAASKPYQNTPWVFPSMSNGAIVWSAIEGVDGVEHVYAINADGTNLRMLQANAVGPQITWPWVVYDSISLAPSARGTLVRENLQTGETQSIKGPVDVSYYAYDGEALAWISADSTGVFLQSPVTDAPRQLFAGEHLQFISLDQRLVGWGQSQGAFAFDRRLRIVVQLSNLHLAYPAISAQAIDWPYQPNPNATDAFSGAVYELGDVSQLP